MLPISMNFKSKRNNMIKSLTLSIGLALTLVAAPAFGAIEWGFDSNANAYPADIGSGSATITLGQFPTGYLTGDFPFNYGSAQGFWDIGGSGSILLSGMGLTGSYTLQVFQWVEGNPIYPGNLTYQINNGDVLPLTYAQITESTFHGGWEQWNATFSLDPNSIVKVTAPNGGAIIDRMVLTVVPEPATMIAGALLLLPFAFSTLRVLRRNRAA